MPPLSAAEILGPAPRKLPPALEAFAGSARGGRIRWWVIGLMLFLLVVCVGVPLYYVNNTLDTVQNQFSGFAMPGYGQQPGTAMPGYGQQPGTAMPGWPTTPGTPQGWPAAPGVSPYGMTNQNPVAGPLGWARNMMWQTSGSVVGMFVLVIVAIIVVTKLLGKSKQKKRRFVLENGSVGNATIVANLIDYSLQINGAPRRTVQMQIDGQPVEFSTFDHNFANLFPQGHTIEVVWHPQAPDATMPVSMLPLG